MIAILLIILIIYFLIKILIGNRGYSIEDKGEHGEALLYNDIVTRLYDNERVLSDLYIPFEEGKYSQIDLICILETGIVVIESKNFDGWIFGNENSKYWMQIIYNVKNQFYNPIRQNNIHIECLKNIIKKNTNYYSLIAFSDECDLKDIKTYSKNVYICYYSRVCKIINDLRYENKVLSNDDIEFIYNELTKYQEVDKEIKISHIHRLRDKDY